MGQDHSAAAPELWSGAGSQARVRGGEGDLEGDGPISQAAVGGRSRASCAAGPAVWQRMNFLLASPTHEKFILSVP